jgi:hypothetical protein
MKKMFVIVGVLLIANSLKAADLITTTLLDHVMPVTQVVSKDTKMALVDSVIQIGSKNKRSIVDLQAGFSGEVKPEPGDVSGVNLIAGGFFKVNTLLSDVINYPDHWKFLNSLEWGPVYFYDFREKRDYAGIQFGLAFSLQPK